MALQPGTRLGPYEIVSPVGSGGMGDVYRARDTRLGRDVAVKVIPAEAEQISDRLARFEREARAVAALNHPNILALHDIGSHDGVMYAVMELLEGQTLRERLDTAGPFTPQKATDYAIQVLRGLAAAHERGITHRDLKPENLFITSDGRAKILDFGLAQQDASSADDWETRATSPVTTPGVVVGTFGYVSPEQVLGQPATVRSDLFAFGVVVYEMLTGSHPFRRATWTDTLTATLREDPPPLARLTPGLEGAIARIIDRCLDKHASDRPGSARDLALYFEAAAAAAYGTPSVHAVAAAEVHGIRNRMLAISCGLMVVLAAGTWVYVRVMANRTVAAAIEADLARAEQLVRRVQRDRLEALSLTARLVASFPELKALFATDSATIRDYLVSYQQRNPEAPLLLALSPDGTVLARTDDESTAGPDNESVNRMLARHGEPTAVQLRGRLYHAAAAAVDVGGIVFGQIVAAMPVDDAFAATLRDAAQAEIVLLSKDGVLASTLRAAQTPWRSHHEWKTAGGRTDRAIDVFIGAQQFAAREIVLVDQPLVSAAVLKSRDEAIEPFRRIQTGVIVIGLLCAVVAAIGSVWIARALSSAFQR